MSSSVLDYGADPTGQGDSRPAFQSAVDAAGPGGTVQVPPGVYSWQSWTATTKHLVLPAGLRLEGSGPAHSTIRVDAYGGPSARAIVADGWGVQVRGLTVDYQRPVDAKKQAHCIFAHGADRGGLVVEDCHLLAGSGDGVYCGTDTEQVVIRRVVGDAARALVTVAGAGRHRSGFVLQDIELLDLGQGEPGQGLVVNFEASDPAVRFYGVALDGVVGQAPIGIAGCVGAVLRRLDVEKLVCSWASATLIEPILRGRVGAPGDGDGYTIVSMAPVELWLLEPQLGCPEGGAGIVYVRESIEGLRDVRVYGGSVTRADPSSQPLAHPSLYQGTEWHEVEGT